MQGAFFCMAAHKCDVVVLFVGCLFFVGNYYPDFIVVSLIHISAVTMFGNFYLSFQSLVWATSHIV